MLKKLFSAIDLINEHLDNKILEIGVRQSMMVFSFQEENLLKIEDLNKIDNFCDNYSVSELTAFQDKIYVHFSNLSEEIISDSDNCTFTIFYKFIQELKNILCTCPALEYVISDSYVKIYIDLPNIYAKDVVSVDKLLDASGILELNNQRPYVLYVKDWE